MKRILVKIGGSTLGHEDTTIEDLVWLQKNGFAPVVVHGGGKMITEWLTKMALPTKFVDGLRVTGEESIDVVVGVLAGAVNKRLVASINATGGRAIGLAGSDGSILRAGIKNPALGLVGEVTAVHPDPLETLIEKGYIPVLAPIGVLESHVATLLNINADTAAAEVGAAMHAEEFIFLTDVPGVMDESKRVLPRLTTKQVDELIAAKVITGGMVPKVEACLTALKGVPTARIIDGRQPHALREALSGKSLGTTLTK